MRIFWRRLHTLDFFVYFFIRFFGENKGDTDTDKQYGKKQFPRANPVRAKEYKYPNDHTDDVTNSFFTANKTDKARHDDKQRPLALKEDVEFYDVKFIKPVEYAGYYQTHA